MSTYEIIRVEQHPLAFRILFGKRRDTVDPNEYDQIQQGFGARIVSMFQKEVAHQEEMSRRREQLRRLREKHHL